MSNVASKIKLKVLKDQQWILLIWKSISVGGQKFQNKEPNFTNCAYDLILIFFIKIEELRNWTESLFDLFYRFFQKFRKNFGHVAKVTHRNGSSEIFYQMLKII